MKDSVSSSWSTLTEHHVRDLMLSANISSTDYRFLIPMKNERANSPPQGYISVYKDQVEKGLRFPLHELVLEICNRLKVSPSQLKPNAHSRIVGFILCAKLYNVPITVDCFFTMFSASFDQSEKLVVFEELPGAALDFLFGGVTIRYVWKREFFFLKPVGKSWNCITRWTHCSTPNIDADLRHSFQELVFKSGMLKPRFWLAELIKKDVLVHGGIEPGVPSPHFTFRYLMHGAAVPKFELLPEDIPHADASIKATNKRPLDAAPSAPRKKKNRASLVSDEAQQQSIPASLVPLLKTLETIFVSKDCFEKLEKQKQEVTSELTLTKSRVKKLEQKVTSELTLTKSRVKKLEQKVTSELTLTKSRVQKLEQEVTSELSLTKSRVQKLEQEVISELTLTKSRVQKLEHEVLSEHTLMKSRVEELEQENDLHKAKRVDSENMTFQANAKVTILEKRMANLKCESDCLREKMEKDVIEEFKSSDEFTNAVQEDAVKYYMDGFETCKLLLLNSGKLPSGFNFDFLDVANAELNSSPGLMDNTAVDPDDKYLKLENA